MSDYMSNAIADITAERCRQMNVEGWTPEHDDTHGRRELAKAAACYAWAASLGDKVREMLTSFAEWSTMERFSLLWPWDVKWWKPTDRRRDLVKAGALIVAEIERLDREAARSTPASDA